jgi:threonine/homoserine/homoserine lactone efflux protein
MSARAFQVLKFSGSIYLLYLAWSMWRKTGAFELNNPGKKFGMPQILFKGFLLNILNTKLSIFFLAFLPLFVSPDGNHPVQQMLILSVLFMAMTLIIFMLYGFLASVVSRYFMGSSLLRIRLQRSFASIFAVLAAKLAMSKQ